MASKEVITRMKADIEYGLLNYELDLKVLRKKLVMVTDPEVTKIYTERIEQIDIAKGALEEKLDILKAHKGE